MAGYKSLLLIKYLNYYPSAHYNLRNYKIALLYIQSIHLYSSQSLTQELAIPSDNI